jgi:uncharacterized membrane protein YuzA (DUF378 family)
MPNIEPIMAATMPIGRIYGAVSSFFFAVLSILFYDIITHTLGIQTFFTAGAYGIVALASVYYFSRQKENKWGYVKFAVMGTLFYDAITGLTVGPLFFHQSFVTSLIGQIPFTAFHLLGNITFAIILSPAIYKYLIKKRKKETMPIINILNPKTI